jgi:hypothetical protein
MKAILLPLAAIAAALWAHGGAHGAVAETAAGILMPVAAVVAALWAHSAVAQATSDIRGPAAVVPLASQQPPARIIIDPPLADSLAQGRVVIPYRTENLRIVPVSGPAALEVSPRVGHVHITVDDGPYRWEDASGDPLIISGLPPGSHRVTIELANANHQTIDKGVVEFTVSRTAAMGPA